MLELTNLKIGNVKLEKRDCDEVKGGTIGLGATAGALSSIGGISPDNPRSPSAREFLSNTAVGAAIPALGVAATVASGGTVPLLVAGASLNDGN